MSPVGAGGTLAELQPAVAVVAEGQLGAAHVEVGVGLRVQLIHVVRVVRASADLDRRPQRRLTQRCVGIEAEAGTRGVVVDDEDAGVDAVVDDVERRVDLVRRLVIAQERRVGKDAVDGPGTKRDLGDQVWPALLDAEADRIGSTQSSS